MATIYPIDPPPTSPRSELKVRAVFSRLERAVIVHSAAWQSRRNGRQSDGEADFVVLVPGHGIVIIEVKGGGIEVLNGTWYSTGGDGKRHSLKNPFDQAKDSKYALLHYLKGIDPALGHVPIVHAVFFPDISVTAALGLNAPQELILDRADLSDAWPALKRVFSYWGRPGDVTCEEIQKITSHIAPTVAVRRLLRDDVADIEKQLIALTAEQALVFQSLKRVRRAAILGGAGSGKTILAAEKARQLAANSFHTLLVCYNSPLKEHLAIALHGSGVEVETFHTLTIREARRARLKIPSAPAEHWYETEAPTLLDSAIRQNGARYDAILIDEAQDFAPNWLQSLQGLVDEGAVLYLFADSHQDLYQRGWNIPDGLIEFELTINCRNSRPIAERVAAIFGDVLLGREVEGPPPKFIEVDRREQLLPCLLRLVETLIFEEAVTADQLVVLTDAPDLVYELRRMGVSDMLFTTLTGHGIPVETILRFKGLEREVVILVITNNPADLKKLAYVGLSRARAALYVVGATDVRRSIAWQK